MDMVLSQIRVHMDIEDMTKILCLGWAGAAVDVPYKVYKVLGNLGAKLYFFRMKFEDKTDSQLLTQATTDQEFNSKFKEIQTTLFDYLKWFEIGPDMLWDDDKPLSKIKCERIRRTTKRL